MMAQKDQMVMLEPEAAAEARHVLVDCGTWSKAQRRLYPKYSCAFTCTPCIHTACR